MDPLSVLIGWGEKLFGGFRSAARADLRIADQARLVRRQLAASFEDWPPGPQTDGELLAWAHKAARGFSVSQPGIDELVRLRPDASRRVRRAIGRVRDDYYAAADLISPTIQTKGLKLGDAIPWRKAFAHFKRCIATLDTIIANRD